MKNVWKIFLSLLLFTTLAAPQAQANKDWPKELTFGVIPVASSRNMTDSFDPLIKHLEKQLKLKVKLQTAGDYSAVITGMQHNHIDLAYLGPKSYCEAAQRAGAEAIAVEVGENGVAGYHGYIITKADSNLKSIEDLKGKRWAFTDPQSTSGTLVPTVYFNTLHIDPESYFSKVIYSGSHEASILSVKAGKVDGASTNDLDFARGLGKGWNQKDFNIIWTSKLIPGSPIAVRKALPDSLKKAIKEAFVSYKDKDGLSRLKISGYAPGEDSMYNEIRTLIAVKKAIKEKQVAKQ